MKDDEVFFTRAELEQFDITMQTLHNNKENLIDNGLLLELENIFSGIKGIMLVEQEILEERKNGKNIFKEVH